MFLAVYGEFCNPEYTKVKGTVTVLSRWQCSIHNGTLKMEWNEVFKNKIKSWNGLILGIVLIAVILPENIDWRWQVVLRKGSWRRDQEDSANITRIKIRTTFFSCNM